MIAITAVQCPAGTPLATAAGEKVWAGETVTVVIKTEDNASGALVTPGTLALTLGGNALTEAGASVAIEAGNTDKTKTLTFTVPEGTAPLALGLQFTATP